MKQFWDEIKSIGTPIIENLDNNDQYKLVTFIVKGNTDTKNVVIISSLSDQNDVISNNICNKIQGTNIFYKTYIAEKGLKTTYSISRDNSLHKKGFFENLMENADTLSPDPFNEKTFIQKYRRGNQRFELEFSILEIPELKERTWTKYNENIVHGDLKEIDFHSDFLNMTRKIWIYTPPNYRDIERALNPLIVLDGKAFLEFTDIKNILDNLIAKGKIPPSLAIFIHNYSGLQRGKDLSCYPPFAKFIAIEVFDHIKEHFNISCNPSDSVLIGSSSGGLIASYIAIEYPEIFGNVLSQSGYYSWSPGIEWFQKAVDFFGKDYIHWWNEEDKQHEEWLIYYYSKHKKEDIKFYINVGKLETRAIDSVRNFHKMLIKKGYSHKYEEYPGGHEYIAWNDYLSDGLLYLIGIE